MARRVKLKVTSLVLGLVGVGLVLFAWPTEFGGHLFRIDGYLLSSGEFLALTATWVVGPLAVLLGLVSLRRPPRWLALPGIALGLVSTWLSIWIIGWTIYT